MDLRLFAGTLGVAAALVACGGGGGTTPPTNIPTPTSTAVATASTTPGVTTASGTVVDDGTGLPLAGVTVKLMPWTPCGPTPTPATSITPENDGCPTPLPSPQVTTAANGTFTLNGVQNGHYLLVIGADAVATVPPGYTTPPGNCGGPCPTPSPVNFTVQATVHDNVTLTGVSQTLVAPTLPSVPSGYTAPAWETNGDYRLATLNATTEMPCLIAWQYERAQNGLAGSSVDEWLLENVRANNAYQQGLGAGITLSPISTGGSSSSGGVACAGATVNPAFTLAPEDAYATNARTLWFAGQYAVYSANGGTNNEAAGYAEFPIDPRSFTDPNHPTWP
jgi:hypothetical protein